MYDARTEGVRRWMCVGGSLRVDVCVGEERRMCEEIGLTNSWRSKGEKVGPSKSAMREIIIFWASLP